MVLIGRYIFCLSLVLKGTVVLAHSGHSHSSTPQNTSKTSASISSGSDSPFAANFKLRSGYEFGQYVGALPGVSSFFGTEELGVNLNYEFQVRQFSGESEVPQTSQASEYNDQDFNNRFSAQVKKALSENANFVLLGEYESNQAVRLSRMINDFNYYAVNPKLTYQLKNDWQLVAGFLYGIRYFPNGTYVVPSGSRTGIGEPISPEEQPNQNSEITLTGVTDNPNEMTLSYGGELGEQSLGIETKYIINNSDLGSRKYNGQSLKLTVEKMLVARVFAQLAYSFENRIFAGRTDRIDNIEVSLEKEISARMTVAGLARNTRVESETNTSNWEGYAQLQYTF